MARVQIHEGCIAIDLEVPVGALLHAISTIVLILESAHTLEAYECVGDIGVHLERKEKE